MFHKDEYIKDTNYYRMEVPGGWLYRYNDSGTSPVFVPFPQDYAPAVSINNVVPLKKNTTWVDDAYVAVNMELN